MKRQIIKENSAEYLRKNLPNNCHMLMHAHGLTLLKSRGSVATGLSTSRVSQISFSLPSLPQIITWISWDSIHLVVFTFLKHEVRSVLSLVFAGSGPRQGLFGEQGFPLKVGRKWFLVNVLKWVQTWVQSGFRVQKWVKMRQNPLFTHFRDIDQSHF